MSPSKAHPLSTKSMIERGGLVNFFRAVRYAARYSEVADVLGHLPTLYEYQEARGMSRSQAFREQRAWRACVGRDGPSLVEFLPVEAFAKKGWTESERMDAIARWLSE